MFSQILKLVPRIEFERMVKQTGAEYASKGFSSWSQFVAMLFCQLGRAHSLREIEGGLKSCEGKLAHLGIEAPARASLAYANAHRPWQLFEQVFYGLYEKVAGAVRAPRKFRFKHKLVSLDSTVIDLCLSIYPDFDSSWSHLGRWSPQVVDLCSWRRAQTAKFIDTWSGRNGLTALVFGS
ncbi:MAG: DUF4372 domain-containing protein [Burkholderiales bacterium]|nr:DUF4372 domain-containing protein [Burkholderiales bacterium]